MTTSRESLRVLQVVLSLDAGGTEKLVIEMTRALREQAQVAVCCLDHPGVWASELTALGIEVVALRRPAGFQPDLGRQIAALAHRFGADVLHCHHYSPFVYGLLAKLRRPGLRIVYTEHGRLSDAPPTLKRRAANILLGRLPGSFFAVSHDLRLHMIAAGFPGHRVGVVHNGISVGIAPASDERAAARHELGLLPDHLAVGTIARLDPVKDLGTLIQAFGDVASTAPEARLVVIGDGPERRSLEQLARERRIESTVIFTGHRDDARDLLPAFEVYANSSVTEGISVTILEAMAACLPVVATRVGGNPEVVADGRTGILAPARDVHRLASSLRTLLVDSRLRTCLGQAGRQRVESEFALDRMVESYFDCYHGSTARAARGL